MVEITGQNDAHFIERIIEMSTAGGLAVREQDKTTSCVVGPLERRQVINPTVPLGVPTCNIFNLSCYTH